MSETTQIFKACGARLNMGDGISFMCRMRAEHGGRHSDEGTMEGKFAFFVMWEGDMRLVSEERVEETLNPT